MSKEFRWISKHPEEKAKHKGEYIAIVGERIVAYGKDALRVLAQAKRTSRDPLLVKVPQHDILVV